MCWWFSDCWTEIKLFTDIEVDVKVLCIKRLVFKVHFLIKMRFKIIFVVNACKTVILRWHESDKLFLQLHTTVFCCIHGICMERFSFKVKFSILREVSIKMAFKRTWYIMWSLSVSKAQRRNYLNVVQFLPSLVEVRHGSAEGSA